ncbi:unnamed protein product [Rotaria sp. Silwood1]|nr:unnamed protein product [Rotaria sp. Silwood1]CAF3390199.1 unnamed protein product [Rotaria sp. Silwood1]CAF3424253.1 unnamed protein product [Rotaria sp. Silwood1]CAF4581185.1 unnamed protein product [Rotaria sp. Silwood1]CAF4875887.1 unnamed protein product [Rotaria sp. Silwood1]
MFIMKHLLFLLCTSLSETNVLERIITTTTIATRTVPDININSSVEQILDTNAPLIIISESNSSSILSENEANNVIEQEAFFDNNYSEQLVEESDNKTEEFHSGPHYEANWTFIDKETVRVVFSLFSISKLSNEKPFSDKHYDHKINLFPTILSIQARSLQSIYSLKYFLFTIRQYKTNIEKVLPMEHLILKTVPSGTDEFFSNSLLVLRLNPKEKYSICIYYYQMNISTQMPDILICQDIMHDHLEHSVHGLLFVLTQYSIIIGLLIVLQGLFTVRKRRLAHIVHQHLINKAQRLRSTLSSVSLVRQSVNLTDTTTEQKNTTVNGHVNQEKSKLKKRITSSPAIVLSEPSIPSISSNKTNNNSDENEPFLRLTNGKNHVHFLLGLDEESDNDDDDDNIANANENIPNDITINPPMTSIHTEPYGDRSDALSSMAHILDTNKPWSKQS